MILADPESREEWLESRQQGIGGSEAGAVLNVSKYKNARSLWLEKHGQAEREDISEKPAVKFGKEAEQYIRELFRLTYPQFMVEYHEFRMYAQPETPWLFATLDGELTDRETGERGILEIKTTEIKNAQGWLQWNGRIPETYYVQCLHQLLATGWDFVILYAHIRYTKDGETAATFRKYTIRRSEVQNDLEYILRKETEFWERGEAPPDMLPEI